MNKNQTIILWIGIVIIVIMGVFPPWMDVNPRVGWYSSRRGYSFISNPPNVRSCRLDASRLYVQWVMVAVITGGLFVTFKDKKQNYLAQQELNALNLRKAFRWVIPVLAVIGAGVGVAFFSMTGAVVLKLNIHSYRFLLFGLLGAPIGYCTVWLAYYLFE